MTDQPRQQRRARKIAMSAEELGEFLTAERTCRVATIGPDGPHVTPLWFVWWAGELWIYSLSRSQRFTDLVRDPRVAVTVDTGHDYLELRGAEIAGAATVVGEVPRTGVPHDLLGPVEKLFAKKYFDLDEMFYDGKHAWVRVTPTKVVSWDFRKLA